MDTRYQKILTEYEEIENELAETSDPQVLKSLGKKRTSLQPVADRLRELDALSQDIAANEELMVSTDADIATLAKEDLIGQKQMRETLLSEIEGMLLPRDPLDDHDAIIEIRAAAGGDEASLFAAELFRAYARYSEEHKFKTHLVSASRNDVGGYKEVVFEVLGDDAYGTLKFESGVHRVQRVPQTEKSGRVHTSTITVAVIPLMEENEFAIDPKDIRIETSTSRGAGGQSVNTTYSAIKATHIPTGITAQSQDERSQQQNRIKALRVLAARVFAAAEAERQGKERQQRLAQIGSGDRSEKIRTYNFPQDRVTDHRINQSFKQINLVLEGKLDPIIEALRTEQKKRDNEKNF